jgi:hypothetical protein
MNSAKNRGARRAELVAVATAMIEGTMNLIEGARKITALRHEVENPDGEIFMIIRAIESETDHFPLGSVRAQCAPEYLKRADEEMQRYLADAKMTSWQPAERSSACTLGSRSWNSSFTRERLRNPHGRAFRRC